MIHFAEELAREAGSSLMRSFGRTGVVRAKGNPSNVLADILNATTIEQVAKVAQRVSGYRAAFKLWDGASAMEARILSAVQMELSRQHLK